MTLGWMVELSNILLQESHHGIPTLLGLALKRLIAPIEPQRLLTRKAPVVMGLHGQ